MPVDTDEVPEPSRSTSTSIAVSLVVRLIDALRMLQFQSAGFGAILPLTGSASKRACRRPSIRGRRPSLLQQGKSVTGGLCGRSGLSRALGRLGAPPGGQQAIDDAKRDAVDEM